MLKATPRTREYIEQGETEGKTLLEAMNDGELEGMQHFDQVIERMIRDNVISQENGLAYATNPSNLLLRLSGLGTRDDGSAGAKSAITCRHARLNPSPGSA